MPKWPSQDALAALFTDHTEMHPLFTRQDCGLRILQCRLECSSLHCSLLGLRPAVAHTCIVLTLDVR